MTTATPPGNRGSTGYGLGWRIAMAIAAGLMIACGCAALLLAKVGVAAAAALLVGGVLFLVAAARRPPRRLDAGPVEITWDEEDQGDSSR